MQGECAMYILSIAQLDEALLTAKGGGISYGAVQSTDGMRPP